jgi:diaminohydroxyphosphoribosylaminopyrimidine deaminase/5-amino-6-(5-phosphoribosylamino)uracil reductase
MHRCIELAQRGAGRVAPNPLVGAVLVHDDRIIGEGWHRQYGQPHAEVNCLASVTEADSHLVPYSTLYVSLEPCAHFGKTPPCSRLIIDQKIPRVVVGCRDPFTEVNGKGIEQVKAAGIEVIEPVLEAACRELNRRFFTWVEQQRPYVILKWAQTADDFMGSGSADRLLISGSAAQQRVHRWRSEEAAILVGKRTALYDNPQLTNRYWNGPQPVRVVIDSRLELPLSLHLFDGHARTVVLNEQKHHPDGNPAYVQVPAKASVRELLQALYDLRLQSILVEGGAAVLQRFLEAGLWDEIRVLESRSKKAGTGLKAPVAPETKLVREEELEQDVIRYYQNT